ncbi:sodium/glucose cotransporter 4 [Aplysia californica]|uniref:Sodium/glucose cotransporter 4 n=1 Tax=Aplysia californica TaxID=6500 RepID=A0ABM1A5M8_APLCA|nr:sodium/glucose cotransporter 4 [Aplysia californica]
MVNALVTEDYACIGVYFFLVIAVSLWSTFRPNKDNAAGYFLAGKNMHWFPVGASIFVSNVGAPKFIGLTGTAAASGFAVAIYEWHAVYLLILLAWIFVPVYVASGSFTMPEYLKKRFGGVRLRVYLSLASLFVYVFTRIAAEMYAGAIFIQLLVGWNLYACVGVILAVTAVNTVAGGLAAVLYVDTLQTGILLIGAAIIFGISMTEVGGWTEFITRYGVAASNMTLSNPANHSCGMPRADFQHIWRDPVTGDIPWTGAIFGLTPLGIWNWCNDQMMVQRCLSAKSMGHSKAGAVFAAVLKVTVFFFWVIPGMVSRILFPDEVACSDPVTCDRVCGNEAGCSNIAYPLLVLRKMPPGVRGVMLAAFLSAIMSTLTSVFNSASSMFTMDIWRRFRKRAPQAELMIVGRVCVVVMIATSIVWIPIMQQAQGGQLWNYLQAITSCITPPWCWVFLLAVFWKRATEQGAFWGLMIATACGACRMVLELTYKGPFCGSNEPDTRPAVLAKVNFLHFAIIISVVTIVSMVVISLLTKPRPPEKLHKVTWWTRHDSEDPVESDSEDDFGIDEEAGSLPEKKTKMASRNFCVRAFYSWLCGVSFKSRPRLTPQQKALVKRKMTDIREEPGMRRVTAVAAIIISVFTTFLLGFFY